MLELYNNGGGEKKKKKENTNIKNCHERTFLKTFIPSKTFTLLTFFKIKKDQEGKIAWSLLW